MQKICKEIIENYCFIAKKTSRKRHQRRREKAKRGWGALIRAGAHIRDNTVIHISFSVSARFISTLAQIAEKIRPMLSTLLASYLGKEIVFRIISKVSD